MSRKNKNIIMITLIIISSIACYFTISYTRNLSNKIEDMPQEFNGGMPPEGQMNEMTNMGTPPEKPESEINSGENMMSQQPPEMQVDRMSGNRVSQTNRYKILVIIELALISLVIVYLALSKGNKYGFKETFRNLDKIIIYILAVIVLTIILVSISDLTFSNNKMQNPLNEESTEKSTKAEDVSFGEYVKATNINLSEYNTNITIDKAGEYTLTGEFNNSVIVNADGEVKLILNNAIIKNELTAAIANISTNDLVINLVDGTTNYLSDGGSSEYDACLYSNGNLTISGNGKLKIYGNQEEGEGIATETKDITINSGDISIEAKDDGLNAGGDGGIITVNDGTVYIKASGDGIDSNKSLVINCGTVYTMGSSAGGDAGIDTDGSFTINGGLVVALGFDMLQTPNADSDQYSLSFNLDTVISSGTLVTLTNSNDEVIVSFEAKENFKTLIISSDKLKEGTFKLYTNGTNSGNSKNGVYIDGNYTKGVEVIVNGITEFRVSEAVTKYGIK